MYCTSGTSGEWYEFTDYQVEEGLVASPFERRLIGTELQLCQRYFQYSKVYWEYTMGAQGNLGSPSVTLAVPMRAAPTYSTVYTAGSNTTVNGPTTYVVGGAAVAYVVGYASGSSGYGYRDINYALSAEL
jgi:hypothetical protein